MLNLFSVKIHTLLKIIKHRVHCRYSPLDGENVIGLLLPHVDVKVTFSPLSERVFAQISDKWKHNGKKCISQNSRLHGCSV